MRKNASFFKPVTEGLPDQSFDELLKRHCRKRFPFRLKTQDSLPVQIPATPTLLPQRLCRNGGNGEKCHAEPCPELVSGLFQHLMKSKSYETLK
jgi:hypothetical protein